MSFKILVAEDEPDMRSGICDNLEFEGYQVDVAENGAIAWDKIQKENYDLVISDVMMPEMSGFDLAKKMQTLEVATALIMLTAKSEEMDKVRGLELGADDYISKPFSLREFLARVKSVLRRYARNINSSSQTKSLIQFGKIELDVQTLQALNNGKKISLSHKEVEIIKLFASKPNEVVSRDELLSSVWGYDELPTTRTVDNFILRLRQKMEENSSDPQHLLTVHGVGYKFIP